MLAKPPHTRTVREKKASVCCIHCLPPGWLHKSRITMLRVTRRFIFHMAHALDGYDGLCANIHGHAYELHVTLSGEPDADGMVMDFNGMKKTVQEKVLDYYDHSLMLKSTDASMEIADGLMRGWGNVHMVPFLPTSENMILDIAGRLRNAFPAGVGLYSLKLFETENNWVEWYASEN